MDTAAILRKRDRQSFDWLYSRYSPLLFGLIRKMAGDDAAAESLLLQTFVATWNTLDSFEGADNDLVLRMLRIARAKVAEHANQKGQYSQGGGQLRGLQKVSSHEQTMAQ